jgi:hypothetical protein
VLCWVDCGVASRSQGRTARSLAEIYASGALHGATGVTGGRLPPSWRLRGWRDFCVENFASVVTTGSPTGLKRQAVYLVVLGSPNALILCARRGSYKFALP